MSATRATLGLVPLLVLLVFACGDGDDATVCGPGTIEQGGQCVVDDRGRRRDVATGAPDVGVEDPITSDGANDLDAFPEAGASDGGLEEVSPQPDATPDATPDESVAVDVGTEPRDDGTCDVGLRVIGHWAGEWEGRVWGYHPLVGNFDQLAWGTVTFEIFCEDSKLLIEGEMTGTANETFPFGGDLVGEYNPDTGTIDMDLVNASVNMIVIVIEFVADLAGTLGDTSFDDGVWSGVSTNPTGAEGEGTWAASPL